MPSLDDLPDGVLGTGAFTLGWNWQPLPVPGQASASGRRVPSDSDRPIYGRVSPVSSAGRTSPVAHLSAFSPSRPHGKARENAEPTSPTASTSKVTPADPHPHPAPMPSPTSALDVYRLAHRCELSSLSTLALDHLVATLTPKTAFPLLLISYLWQDLHQAVQVPCGVHVCASLTVRTAVHHLELAHHLVGGAGGGQAVLQRCG
jgi:hypothetical protein